MWRSRWADSVARSHSRKKEISPPIQLATQASGQQPWPSLVVQSNPSQGLTGLASWFWVAGGADIPPATATAGPLTVTVSAQLVDVTWDFGDGKTYDAGRSLGRPYPNESDVQHTYQTDSYGIPGGYDITMTLRFDVVYRVNGGAWIPLGSKSKTYAAKYPVDQAQPEIGAGG